MQAQPECLEISSQPRNDKGPLFDEPWQLTAFGIVHALYEKGCFTWPEWVEYLSKEIALARDYGVSDQANIYHHRWLAALERIVIDRHLTTMVELASRKEAWRDADEHRDFGKPLALGQDHLHDRHHDLADDHH